MDVKRGIKMKQYCRMMLCLSLALSFLALPFTGLGESPPAFFSDVPEDQWFYPYVLSLHGKQILKGKTETEFFPQDKLSVCELAALICRYHNLDGAAEQKRQELISSGAVGADLWYSGYIALMLDGGILAEGECNLSTKNGIPVLSQSAREALDSPVLRKQAADMIARSFELSPYPLESRAMHPEVSLYGHNFIAGGGYDAVSLDGYAGDIADYDLIEEKYRLSVKKCYYNGIFGGDHLGLFHPDDSLTRAEAAKIISCTLDLSLRARKEYRLIDGAILSFAEDGESLTPGAKQALFAAYGKRIGFSGTSLTMTLENIVPFGYSMEVVVHRQIGARCYAVYTDNLNTPAADYPSYPRYFEVSSLDDGQPRAMTVLLVLRNLRENGAIEATAEYSYDPQGNFTGTVVDIK